MHTPGPWNVNRRNHVLDGRKKLIANTWNAALMREEMEANTRLIAAAPDLLAACEGVIEMLNRPLDLNAEPEWSRDQVVAAVAKARAND
jgi:hypothetical protein